MEPASNAELMLRTYEAFLFYLAVLLAAFAGVSFFAYLAFLCEECLSPLDFFRSHFVTRHSSLASHHSS